MSWLLQCYSSDQSINQLIIKDFCWPMPPCSQPEDVPAHLGSSITASCTSFLRWVPSQYGGLLVCLQRHKEAVISFGALKNTGCCLILSRNLLHRCVPSQNGWQGNCKSHVTQLFITRKYINCLRNFHIWVTYYLCLLQNNIIKKGSYKKQLRLHMSPCIKYIVPISTYNFYTYMFNLSNQWLDSTLWQPEY